MEIITSRIRDAQSPKQIAVNSAIPSLFLLLGDVLVRARTIDWLNAWPHELDPLSRFGRNLGQLPEKKEIASRMLLAADHYDQGAHVAQLSIACYSQLPAPLQDHVMQTNENLGPFIQSYPSGRSANQIIAEYQSLPWDFRLPFVTQGMLTFEDVPFELCGVDFEVQI